MQTRNAHHAPATQYTPSDNLFRYAWRGEVQPDINQIIPAVSITHDTHGLVCTIHSAVWLRLGRTIRKARIPVLKKTRWFRKYKYENEEAAGLIPVSKTGVLTEMAKLTIKKNIAFRRLLAISMIIGKKA